MVTGSRDNLGARYRFSLPPCSWLSLMTAFAALIWTVNDSQLPDAWIDIRLNSDRPRQPKTRRP